MSAAGTIQCWGYNQHGGLGNGQAGLLVPTVVMGSPFDGNVFHDGFERD